MSKKNLARSAIEGGRTGGSKWERRYSHKENRAHEKEYISKVTHDEENYYDYDIPEPRTVYKEFDDKLGPLYRWLDRQIGNKWNDVLSLITKTFDTRTTAGRHIINDHLLRSVEVVPDQWRLKYYSSTIDDTTSHFKYDYYVDGDGMLCKRKYIPRERYTNVASDFDIEGFTKWLNGRIVGKVGGKLFWFTPAEKSKKWGRKAGYSREWKVAWNQPVSYWYGTYRNKQFSLMYIADVPEYVKDKNGKVISVKYIETWVAGTPDFKQSYKLKQKDLEYWNSVPNYYTDQILDFSPLAPKPKKTLY